MQFPKNPFDIIIMLSIAVVTFLILVNFAAPHFIIIKAPSANASTAPWTLNTPTMAANTASPEAGTTQSTSFPTSSVRILINDPRVPIIFFHYIRNYSNPRDKLGESLSVLPREFEKYLIWLKNNNYQTVNPDYLVAPYALTKKPIVISFDDGYEDAYLNVYPLLKKYDFMGTFYIIVNKVGTPGYLTWNQIKEMHTNGMNIGSHTLNHLALNSVSPTILEKEVTQSKNILEQKLQQKIEDFCYPYGAFNSHAEEAVKEAGYKVAVTTEQGVNNLDNVLDLYAIKRIRLGNNADILRAINLK